MTDGQTPTILLMDTGNLRIQIPMTFEMNLGSKLILMPQTLDGENPDAHTPAQEAIITALARAFAWTEMLERGEVASISDLARRLEVDSSYIGRILRLTTLAPDIIEAILQGQEPNGLSLAKLTKTLSEDWLEQRKTFGIMS